MKTTLLAFVLLAQSVSAACMPGELNHLYQPRGRFLFPVGAELTATASYCVEYEPEAYHEFERHRWGLFEGVMDSGGEGVSAGAVSVSETLVDGKVISRGTIDTATLSVGEDYFLTSIYHYRVFVPGMLTAQGTPYFEQQFTGRNTRLDIVEPGDLDGDGRVSFGDFLILSEGYGQAVEPVAGYVKGDIDQDQLVGFGDFLILAENYGAAAVPVVEASGRFLFAFGLIGLFGLRRRR